MKPAEDAARWALGRMGLADRDVIHRGHGGSDEEGCCVDADLEDIAALASLIRRSREEGARWALEKAALVVPMTPCTCDIECVSCRGKCLECEAYFDVREDIRAIDPAGAAGEGGTNAD